MPLDWPSLDWVFEARRAFHQELAARLTQLAGQGGGAAGWGLVAASLAYGIFHAAGPGHGKAVVAAYLFTHESRIRRGLALAALASLAQGVVAILVVYGLIYGAGWAARDTQAAVAWTERASFALLAAMGAGLAFSALRRLAAARPKLAAITPADPCCAGIVPSAAQLDAAADWRRQAGLILSIGLRPCSGAVLVLALARALGIAWAGMAAVLAMALGTAATVAALAVLTLKARRWTMAAFLKRHDGLRRATDALALLGGGLITLLAASLLAGSFAPAHPLGL